MTAIDNARAALDSLIGDVTHSASTHEMSLADALRDLIAEHERFTAVTDGMVEAAYARIGYSGHGVLGRSDIRAVLEAAHAVHADGDER
jgi:hypothetical protein